MLTSVFHRFFTIFKKTFRVPLVPCPAVVPGLSHAFGGTGKLLKQGHLALFFDLVPPFSRKKVIFVSVCAPIRGHFWPDMGPFVIQVTYKRGRLDPFSDTIFRVFSCEFVVNTQKNKTGTTNYTNQHEKTVSRRARKGRKEERRAVTTKYTHRHEITRNTNREQ